jgi:hypothetical protein
MGPNACAKSLRLGDQLFLCQGFQIFVQVITYLQRATAMRAPRFSVQI